MLCLHGFQHDAIVRRSKVAEVGQTKGIPPLPPTRTRLAEYLDKARHFELRKSAAELVEQLLTNISEERIGEIRNKRMIDLSPISYLQNDTEPKGDG